MLFEIHDRTTDERFVTDNEENAAAFYDKRTKEYPHHVIVINRKDTSNGPDAGTRVQSSGRVPPHGGDYVAAIRGGASGTVRPRAQG